MNLLSAEEKREKTRETLQTTINAWYKIYEQTWDKDALCCPKCVVLMLVEHSLQVDLGSIVPDVKAPISIGEVPFILRNVPQWLLPVQAKYLFTEIDLKGLEWHGFPWSVAEMEQTMLDHWKIPAWDRIDAVNQAMRDHLNSVLRFREEVNTPGSDLNQRFNRIIGGGY